MMDVVCLGLIVCDLLVKPITKEMLDGDSTRVEFVKMNSGGDAFNVAVNLSKLGIASGIVGKIGDDPFGRFLLETAAKSKVDCRGLAVAEKSGTSTSLVMIHPDGERSFAYYGGASDQLSEEDVKDELIKDAKILSVGSALALPGLDGAGLGHILARARKLGIKTVVDVTEVKEEACREKIVPLLKNTDIFMPSCHEAKIISGREKPEDMAQVLSEKGAGLVVIKLGDKGCYVSSRQESFFMPAFGVNAVDSTGAGDSFVAGFLAAYSKGKSLRDCSLFANAAGAMCVREVGATAGIKSFEQLMDFIREKSGAVL